MNLLLWKKTTGPGLAKLAEARGADGARWLGIALGDWFIGIVCWPRRK